MATTTKRADFEAVFPDLVVELLAHAQKYGLPENAMEWFQKVCAPPIFFSMAFLRFQIILTVFNRRSMSMFLAASSTVVSPFPIPASPSSKSP